MPNGNFRTWLHVATLIIVIVIAILHFRSTWRIERLGQDSYATISEAVNILRLSQSDVQRAGENSDKLVANSELALQKVEALEERLDRLEAELREHVQYFRWIAEHPTEYFYTSLFKRQGGKSKQ